MTTTSPSTTRSFIAAFVRFRLEDSSLKAKPFSPFRDLSAIPKSSQYIAIKDLVVDGLVVVTDDETGILYSISESGRKMSKGFKSEYAENYKKLIRLVAVKYGNYSDVQLLNAINRQSTKSLRR